MIEYIFRPIDKWPRELTKKRSRYSRFDTSFDRNVRQLAAEVEKAGGRRVVIQLALEFGQIRRDGLPYSDAKPKHPGVIVSFDGKHGPVKMPCDAFEDWRDNLRAITLTLEHLRGIDRYGVSTHGEQYRGWTALPPAPGTEPEMTATEAAEFLASQTFIGAQWILDTRDAFDQAYRNVAKKLHPDVGGDEELFKKLQKAAALIRAHHGDHAAREVTNG